MTVTVSRLDLTVMLTASAQLRRLKRRAYLTPTSVLSRTTRTTGTTAKKVDRDGDGVDDRAEGAGKGAGVGAGLGGAAGLLAGRAYGDPGTRSGSRSRLACGDRGRRRSWRGDRRRNRSSDSGPRF